MSDEANREMMQKLSSIQLNLEEKEKIFTIQKEDAENRLREYKNKIKQEFDKLRKSINDREDELMSWEEKYRDKKQELDTKLFRVTDQISTVKRMTSSPTPLTKPALQAIYDVLSDDVPDDVTLELCQDDISNVIEAIKSLGKPQQKDVLYFDNKCGSNIKIFENNKRAQRFQHSENGIVLSSQPMEKDTLYQVLVREYDAKQKKGTMMIGVWWKNDEQNLPYISSRLESSQIIGKDGIWMNGDKEHNGSYGKKLGDVRDFSTVGIAIHSDNKLHLYIDGDDCGPSPVSFPEERNLPVAVFDVKGKIKEIQALPLLNVRLLATP